MDCRAGSKFVTFFFLKNNLVFVICLLESERQIINTLDFMKSNQIYIKLGL